MGSEIENEKKTLIEKLMKDCGFAESFATAFVKANGRCAYCNEDMLLNRYAYSNATVDHILPKSDKRYETFKDDSRNWILSCNLCNSIKRAQVVLEDGETADNMLNNRDELIRRVKEKIIIPERVYWDKQWLKVLDIFLNRTE